jgi:alkylation response protein AidB-like acyl-CoA dehydrogenase
MDFQESPEVGKFRAELREFLDAELPDWWRGLLADDDRTMPFTRRMCQKLAQRGWLTMSWPTEFGGTASDLWTQMALREEMWTRHEPRGPQYMNVNYIGPMIMRFGTAEQHARFLPPMSAGNVIWTQGFSEPDAGSDLAAISTRATPVDGGYVVNGSKIWSSYADAPADWCFLLVRTDPTSSRHKGLSMLLVDMLMPGVTVRPILSMVGPREFNEIFFDDVFVPSDCRLGPENEAWSMVMAGLALERAGVPWYAMVAALIPELVEYCNNTVVDGKRLSARPEVRASIAELHCATEAARLLHYRVVSCQQAGVDAPVESAISIMHSALVFQQAGQVALDTVGPLAALRSGDPSAPLDGLARHSWMLAIASSIAGGTIDIQRNIVAQRGLRLPKAG